MCRRRRRIKQAADDVFRSSAHPMRLSAVIALGRIGCGKRQGQRSRFVPRILNFKEPEKDFNSS